MDLLNKIKRKWIKWRLQPIRVFCFHQVSDTFDSSTMYPGDWLQTDEFKKRVISLQDQGYTFISLTDAHEHIKHDFIRMHKYAVLTADDGWTSLKNILPWLSEQRIPITLFLNPAYLDGKHFRECDTEKYLTEEEVENLHVQFPYLEIGSHGWEHVDATKQTEKDFEENISKSVKVLSVFPNYVPYFAFTWGYCNSKTFKLVLASNLIPVLMNGEKNYNNALSIYRELLK